MKYLLGIDLGSSSVKVSLVEAETGKCVASASYPETEAPIKAVQPGWAEQKPDDWWEYFKNALSKALSAANCQSPTANSIAAVGISYQMHGLVCVDKDMKPLRDAIIWCDSRGVPYGEKAFREMGEEWCMSHLKNSPGNFTAAKLAWVKENEPSVFERIHQIMLPGDYLAFRLTGEAATTACGLSEMMLWDYHANATQKLSTFNSQLSTDLMDYFGFPNYIIPTLVPTFGEQGRLSATAAKELGLEPGIPITYRAGDQPNNALSLHVLNPGEIAATAGTSGVVYGVMESGERNGEALNEAERVKVESGERRVNTFLHVNHNLGLMHCVNGCGILNAWMRRNVTPNLSYDEMNRLAATVPVGSEGVSIVPFGNGAERVMENRDLGCSLHGIDFNRHGQAHLLRAAQEGIAFALYYGMEVMHGMGMNIDKIHAGKANMFLSPIFRETLANVSGATIELYDTDGSVGAARGAGLGAGVYANADEAFASLKRLAVIEPDERLLEQYKEAYMKWKNQQINK